MIPLAPPRKGHSFQNDSPSGERGRGEPFPPNKEHDDLLQTEVVVIVRVALGGLEGMVGMAGVALGGLEGMVGMADAARVCRVLDVQAARHGYHCLGIQLRYPRTSHRLPGCYSCWRRLSFCSTHGPLSCSC